MPEITENPEVLLFWTVTAYALSFSDSIVFSLYCLDHPLVPSHTIGSTGLLALLSRLYYIDSYCLIFFIVLTYYTAFDRHSIYSSTFLYRAL